jgi:hypothetical protein
MWCKRNGVSGRLFSMGVDDAAGSLSLTTFNDLLGMKVELTDNVMLLNGSPVGDTGDPFRFLVLQRRAGTMQILAGDNAGAVTLRGTYFFGGTISGKLTIGDKILASGAAEGTQTNFWFDELLVSSDTALFTAPFTAPTTEFTYFPWTGGGPGGGSQTIRYFPAYGDPDRHFPVGVYEVPAGSSIATLQAEIDARGSVRMANAPYSGNLIIRSGQKIYGYPQWGNGSRVTGTITVAPGATDFAVIGVSANNGFVFPASSLVTKRGAFGMTFGNYDGIGSTLENITFNRCNGQPYLNNTGSGYTRNCRWHSMCNSNAGFNGKPGGAVLGNDVTRQNWGNVFLGYMPLNGSTCNLWLAGARDAMVVGMVLEEYGPHPDDGGKPTLQFQSMDRAFVLGHSGRSENTEGTYSDAAKALFIGSDMTTGANLVVTRWGPNTQTAVAMHWRDDSGGTVNLAPASTRLTQVEPAVLLNNGSTTPPTGAALTAALDTIVSPIATTKAWARPTLRVIQDPVPNWRALRGAAADERAAVQNIIDLAGVNGTVKINRPYYIGGQVFAKSGQVFDMSAGGVLIAKTDTFAILGTDFQVTTTGTKTLTVLDGVFYGGTAGYLQTEDNMQLTFFFFSGCTFRGQTLCGMGIVDSYAWDNGWIEKCNFTDGNHGIYSTGTDVPQGQPGHGTGPLISYIDKVSLFRCQITNMSGFAYYTQATRPHNLNGIDECWIENCASGAVRTDGQQNQNYIANSVIKNCGGATAINCLLSQTTVVSCDITGSAANTALISNACCVEGNDLSPGPGSAIIMALRPEDPFATFARPLLFNNTSTASLGPVQSFPMRMGLVFGNNQLPVGDPAAYGKPLGSIEYYTQGSGQVDDDTRVLKVFVDGPINSGTRFLRDDGFLTLVDGDVTVNITGVEALGQAGNVVRSVSTGLTGVAGTGAVGTLDVFNFNDVTLALTGVAGAGAVGTVGVTGATDITIPITGVGGTGAVGTLVQDMAVALAGVQGLGGTGVVTWVLSDITVGLTGVEGTGAVGVLTVAASTDLTIPISGVGGLGDVGTLAPDAVVGLAGAAGTGEVGTVTSSGGSTATPDGGSSEYVIGRYGRTATKPILYRTLEEKARRSKESASPAKRRTAAQIEDEGARLVLGDPTEAQFAALAARWAALHPELPLPTPADAQAYFRAAVAAQLRAQHAEAVAAAEAHLAALVQAEKDRQHEEDSIIALLLA